MFIVGREVEMKGCVEFLDNGNEMVGGCFVFVGYCLVCFLLLMG